MSTSPPPKRRKRNNGTSLLISQNVPFLTLSDDVLLMIFQNLTSASVLAVSETCLRFQTVCQDKSLWKMVDFLDIPPMDLKSIKKCIKRLHSRTESLALKGFLKTKGKVNNLSEALFVDINKTCENLQTLKLEHFFIHGDHIGFEHFPKMLKHLSLKGCEVDNLPSDKSYFKNIHVTFKNLETLCLAGCGWVKNHCLMAICKIDTLVHLDLNGCFRIGECFAYTALATRFGFNSVRWLDLRGTNITDSELPCFGRKKNLKEMLVGGEFSQRITDRGILSLCDQPLPMNIEKLTMNQTSVTDTGLALIATSMKTLRYLDMKDSPVTERGVQSFLSTNPLCEIIYSK